MSHYFMGKLIIWFFYIDEPLNFYITNIIHFSEIKVPIIKITYEKIIFVAIF